MKKIVYFALALLGIWALLPRPAHTDTEINSIAAWQGFISEKTTYTWIIDKHGFFIPGKNASFDIGTPTEAVRTVYVWNIVSASGALFNVTDNFPNVPSVSSVAYASKLALSTTTLVATGFTWYSADMTTSPFIPRNLTFQAQYAGTPASSNSITVSALVKGYDSVGRFAQETIAFSTAQGVGNVAFSSVTSIFVQASSAPNNPQGTVNISIGDGLKLGLTNSIKAAADVYHVTIGTSGVDESSQTVNAVYDTIQFTVNPNDITTYKAWYRVRQTP